MIKKSIYSYAKLPIYLNRVYVYSYTVHFAPERVSMFKKDKEVF